MKKVKVSILGRALEEWESLSEIERRELEKGIENSDSQRLLRSIRKKIELIKSDPQYGDSVPKRLIPKAMPVDNLWVVDLAGFWRMLYTLKGARVEILCFILDICDHGRYNSIFGYRKK